MKNRTYTRKNIEKIEPLQQLSPSTIEEMKIVARVLPFKTNSYIIENLINWERVPDDPIFRATFPLRDMLHPYHFRAMEKAIATKTPQTIKLTAQLIRQELNPDQAGQKLYNVPIRDGKRLSGIQHKYPETVLFFPQQGQSCHAYCTFCFRWPQFVFRGKNRFAAKETDDLISYLKKHPKVTDLLITGGDPMVMSASLLKKYIHPILNAEIPHLRTLRIGTKTLSHWPYRYTKDRDAKKILQLFTDITESGLNLAFQAHVNHFQELNTPQIKAAVDNIHDTGALIRTQSPILRHVNNHAKIWATMWQRQLDLGMIPYYMFIARDTGAQHYFSVPLVKAWRIYRDAYSQVSGLARTVRGPSMSCTPGKVQILGVSVINGVEVFVLQFLQGRNPQWVGRPFYARYNPSAIWIDELTPAFSHEFFFDGELETILQYHHVYSNSDDSEEPPPPQIPPLTELQDGESDFEST